jgi:hypothetical protein
MANNTINQNVIVPEVYAQLVRDKIDGKVIMSQFNKRLGDLVGKPGETLTMPSWSYIGDATDWDISTPMDVTQMTQSEKSATIKAIKAPAVQVADYDDEVAMGNAINEAASQQAIAIARKLDIDTINECLTSPLKVGLASKNEVTQAELLEMLGVFGDERDASEFACIAIHSTFATSLYSMDLFVSREKTTVPAGSNNGITVNGVIGYFLDIPVILSDRLYDSVNAEPFIIMMKKESVSYIPKETPFVETERVANLRRTNIYASQFYAVKLTKDDGVVYAKKSLPTQQSGD